MKSKTIISPHCPVNLRTLHRAQCFIIIFVLRFDHTQSKQADDVGTIQVGRWTTKNTSSKVVDTILVPVLCARSRLYFRLLRGLLRRDGLSRAGEGSGAPRPRTRTVNLMTEEVFSSFPSCEEQSKPLLPGQMVGKWLLLCRVWCSTITGSL